MLDVGSSIALLVFCFIVIVILVSILVAVRKQTQAMQSIDKKFSDFTEEQYKKEEL